MPGTPEKKEKQATENTKERARPKPLVQPDIRTVTSSKDKERKGNKKQEDSRTVIVKQEEVGRQVKLKKDTKAW